jgi:uncharacterized membrane protein YjgN (DUF898 family)
VSQTPPSGQPPYGPPNPYGNAPYALRPPEHPQAILVLILGILGIVVCGLVAPFAWVMGTRVVREIDASNGQLGGRSEAQTGRICGMVGTGFLALGLLAAVVAIIFVLIAASTSTT